MFLFNCWKKNQVAPVPAPEQPATQNQPVQNQANLNFRESGELESPQQQARKLTQEQRVDAGLVTIGKGAHHAQMPSVVSVDLDDARGQRKALGNLKGSGKFPTRYEDSDIQRVEAPVTPNMKRVPFKGKSKP